MAPQKMATRWLRAWLTGLGLHGLQPAPHESLVGWLLSLHERAITVHEAALEDLSPDQAAVADQLLHEVISAQKETLPASAQILIQEGDLLAVRSAEVAAVVWTLAGIDAFTDSADNLPSWRDRLQEAAVAATNLDRAPAMLAEAAATRALG